MPWKACTPMSERHDLVRQAAAGAATMSALSRAYGVSRKTAYKWLKRYRTAGQEGLADQSRRPHQSPRQVAMALEERVCELRRTHPAWGGRKLHHRLVASGIEDVPAPSTITSILKRNDLLDPERRQQRAWQRFEAEEPNALWQMDFKGHFAFAGGRAATRSPCSTTIPASASAWRPVAMNGRRRSRRGWATSLRATDCQRGCWPIMARPGATNRSTRTRG